MDFLDELKAIMDIALKPEFDLAINEMIEKSYRADIEKLGPNMACLVKLQWEQIKPNLFLAYCLGAKAQAVPYEPGSFKSSHEIIINETKSELIDGYDIAKEDEYLLESLVYRGVCIGKAQAVPEVMTIGNELQSWVAVWSFSAKNDGEDYVVVDANLLAEKIERLTGANQ